MTCDARVRRPLVALLAAVVLVALAVAEGRAQAPPRRSLAGRLLVATEAMRDPRFARTVIYLMRHREEGALGLIINVPMGEIPFERALKPLGLEAPPGSGDLQVYYGGPVEPGQGFILHTPDWKSDGTTVVNEHFAFTQNPKILESMARANGPRRALFCLGYAGWAPGQLDAELATGSWGIATADERLVFETAPAQKWIEAMARRILEL